MDLIVTHKNADFDALSSLVAAGKLYPGARLLLPGSQEKAVRSFLALIKDKVSVEREKTCRMDDVKRLIIVDNRHASRIGDAERLLRKKGMKVHIYDHHPRTGWDIKADKDVFKEVGATVSILLEILEKKGKLSLSPLEATLMLLGIYEETGSLSYSTTTRLDVDMVGRLLEMGANLNAVSSYLNRELSERELSILVDLLRSVEVVRVGGVDVAFANVEAPHFEGEMGTVVHKLQDVENLPVLFVIFRSKSGIKIMARSRIENIDVNALLAVFGGAGHKTAASAKLADGSPGQIKTDIIRMLRKDVDPEIFARDIMSSPIKAFSQDEKVSSVLKKLKADNIKGAPVLDDEAELAGMITMRDIKKAYRNGMEHSRIKGYMSRPVVTAGPDTPLYELRAILMEKGKGRIPVVDKGKIVGIVTRTDVLRQVHGSLFPDEGAGACRRSNIGGRMKKMLPKRLMELIRDIAAEADTAGMNIFLVGGFVRDLLLGQKNFDLDMVVEGNAIDFGRKVADMLGAALVVHKKFGTCTVVMDWPGWLGASLHADNKFKIDIATARKEVYERPAALPTVEFSSLKEDLFRRDFTINAMAVNINRSSFGLFVDFFGGVKDLEKKTIRILHDRSFLDDPTRIFRAVRFEQRLNFSIDRHTEYLIQHAIKQEMFSRTENQRIRDELILMLKEPNPEKAVARMKHLHELRFIHGNLSIPRDIKKRFNGIRRSVGWYRSNAKGRRQLDVWLMNLMVLLERLEPEEISEVAGKFVLTRSDTIRVLSAKKVSAKVLRALSCAGKLCPSSVYTLLEPLSHEAALYLMARTASVKARNRIKRFFREYNGVKLLIKGDDLTREGLKPGPDYSRILKEVLCGKLDGKLTTKKQEIAYLRGLLKKEQAGKSRTPQKPQN